MRIGLFTPLFSDKSLDQVMDIAQDLGITALELGAGAYPGSPHLPVEKLLESKKERDALLKKFSDRGMILSGISVHGNPLHPNTEIANDHHNAFVNAVKLADALDIRIVNGFSGCPGDGPRAKNPNWVTCAWPDEYREILDWQWSKRVIPYWRKQAQLLKDHNVKFAIELHPGFVAYSNEHLFQLRDAIGKNGSYIGTNFDPSHLFWQGIDPLKAVRELLDHDAVFHVHAKDVRIDPVNSELNGNLDAKSYGDISKRSWVFRSVGYGHGVEWWRDFVSVLRANGYDHVLSIEHEDGLMSPMEGLSKAVETLKSAVIVESAGEMFWAKD
ncbi:MAG: sugar phosphate isomerase/epimerase [Armatimonadetes bacterium]|nr:sugar phosphate isomerase/epimerase [Armatimonadota bacterium]